MSSAFMFAVLLGVSLVYSRVASSNDVGSCHPTMFVLAYGDSKTVEIAAVNQNQAIWQNILWPISRCKIHREQLISIATNGITTAGRQAVIDANLAATNYSPSHILYNLGSNDAFYGDAEEVDEAAWKVNLAYILDAFHAKWPIAQIYYSETWRQGYDVESDRLATWYADVTAGRDYVHRCDNERSWVKGADDGATMFWDGIHFSVAGAAEKARLAAACLGF